MTRGLYVVIVLLLFNGLANAQFIKEGFPRIVNYSPEEYEGHIQNWGFAEDSNGVLYIANLQGIIKYDGVNWKDITISNSRSYGIHYSHDDRMYVGGINEFGFLGAPTDSSSVVKEYFSLRHLVPDTVDLGRFFEISSNEEYVYFQSNSILIRYDGAQVDYFFSDVRFSYLFKLDDEIYVREALEGLKKVEGDSLILIPGGEYFADKNIVSYIDHPEGDIFCEYNRCNEYVNGSFSVLDMEVNDYLNTHYLDEAITLEDSTLLFATRQGGIVHTTSKGDIINIINEETGLVSNTVYGIYEDRNGSVWVATINGISQINFSLPVRYFDDRSGIDTEIISISGNQDNLILGGSGEAYLVNRNGEMPSFTFTGICSDALTLQSGLYMLCGEILSYYENGEFKNLLPGIGYKMAKFRDPNLIILGNSRGFRILSLNGDSAQELYVIDDLEVVPNSIVVDDKETIWVGNKLGVYRIVLEWTGNEIVSHAIEQYLDDVNNESNDVRAFVTLLDNEPAFLTWGKGIQRYDQQNNKMYQELRYGSSFSDTTKQFYLAEQDREGNIWFRYDSEYQAAIMQDEEYKRYVGPLRLIDQSQSNDIYVNDQDYVWYGTDQGMVRYQKNHSFDHAFEYHTQLNEVLVRNDSLINGGTQKQIDELAYKDNELRFTFAGASYFKPEETEYRTRLEGFDQDWGVWSHETQKDYTNIPEGIYTFRVQSRNMFGQISSSAGFSFTVLPPWYRTWWAYLLYAVSISALLYSAYKVRINQLLRVERIRNNIASDLHDEVSATLSSISYFAQAIESDKVKGDKSRFLKLITDSAGDAKEKITDIVWAINPEHDDWRGFLSKCRRYASDLLESKNINYSLKITEFIPGKLDMQLRQHLWLIFKEMVTNAARHSGANNVDIIINYEEGVFRLVVQDDGSGMDVDHVKKGNGLININKRADLVDGEVSLKTSSGFGTRWILKLKL